MITSLGWEGNRRSGVALAMRLRDSSGLSTYRLDGLCKGDEHPRLMFLPEYGPLFTAEVYPAVSLPKLHKATTTSFRVSSSAVRLGAPASFIT